MPAADEIALPRWVEALVAFMQRSSAHLTDYFKLPIDAVRRKSVEKYRFEPRPVPLARGGGGCEEFLFE